MIDEQSIIRITETHAKRIGQAGRRFGGYWSIVFCHGLSLGLTATVGFVSADHFTAQIIGSDGCRSNDEVNERSPRPRRFRDDAVQSSNFGSDVTHP